MGPSKEQALSFAIMLQAGLPASQAILYFFPDQPDPKELGQILDKWVRSPVLASAQKQLLGKSWQEMSLDEQCNAARNYAYAGMAYFLFSHNYGEVGSGDKAKFDTALKSIEERMAGTAGRGDALSRFMDDFIAAKKLKGQAGTPTGGAS